MKPKKYQAGTAAATDPLGMYKNKLGAAPMPSGYPGNLSTPLPPGGTPGPAPVPGLRQPMQPLSGQRPMPQPRETPVPKQRPDVSAFNNWAAAAGAPGYTATTPFAGMYPSNALAKAGGASPGDNWWDLLRQYQQGGGFPGYSNLPAKPAYPSVFPPGSGSFYPQREIPRLNAQAGTEDVDQIGEAQKGYPFQVVPLSAPQLESLRRVAEQQGLSKDQITGLTQAFGGFKQAYGAISNRGMNANYAAAGSPTPVFGESGYPSAIPVGGYSSGISEVGYPPFIAPGADYHADKGGWIGPYDPLYMIPHYRRGTDFVGGGPSTTAGGGQAGGWEWSEPGALRGTERYGENESFGPDYFSWTGAPGFPWSNTMIPTTYNAQGYPRAVPVGFAPSGPDYGLLSGSRHMGERKTQ